MNYRIIFLSILCSLFTLISSADERQHLKGSLKLLSTALNDLKAGLKKITDRLEDLKKELVKNTPFIVHKKDFIFNLFDYTKVKPMPLDDNFFDTLFKTLDKNKLDNEFPYLANYVDTKELLKELVFIFAQEQKKYQEEIDNSGGWAKPDTFFCCLCSDASVGMRIAYAMTLADAALKQYPDNKQEIVLTEFSEGRGFQAYVDILCLLKAGYTNIYCNIIDILSDEQMKKVKTKIDTALNAHTDLVAGKTIDLRAFSKGVSAFSIFQWKALSDKKSHILSVVDPFGRDEEIRNFALWENSTPDPYNPAEYIQRPYKLKIFSSGASVHAMTIIIPQINMPFDLKARIDIDKNADESMRKLKSQLDEDLEKIYFQPLIESDLKENKVFARLNEGEKIIFMKKNKKSLLGSKVLAAIMSIIKKKQADGLSINVKGYANSIMYLYRDFYLLTRSESFFKQVNTADEPAKIIEEDIKLYYKQLRTMKILPTDTGKNNPILLDRLPTAVENPLIFFLKGEIRQYINLFDYTTLEQYDSSGVVEIEKN